MNILLKDFKALKNNEFITLTGKIIKFEKNIDKDSWTQINNRPLVRNIDTNDEIILIIDAEAIIGRVYRFNYLKHSKIAEIIEEIEIGGEK